MTDQTPESAQPKHGPDLSTQGLPTCLCGRTFWSWRAQGIHETAERRKRSSSPGQTSGGDRS